ncbi:class I SAM-dependent methyltransferase [Flavobacterium sp.]|uniref:class I SAM-dependent methyltransferase n=1 Tax=Flavobacterium sp. TaxID=239 RepID=UPI00374DB964
MKRNFTGERLETFIYNRIAIEHLHRYSMVFDYVKDKVVLDIASGEGYGSNLLSEHATFVYGVDIDEKCINDAKLKYKKNNIEFKTGNTSKIPLENGSIDVVLSFETIEHHDEHEEMMMEIKRVLKPNGLLIISTPDKLYYSDKRKVENEFHVKELYKEEFTDLISKYFDFKQMLSQLYNKGTSLIVDSLPQNEIKFFTGNYTHIKDKAVNPLFHIIIASNVEFKNQSTSVFDGAHLINAEIAKQIHKSATYKLGHFILFPFKLVKKIIKKIL